MNLAFRRKYKLLITFLLIIESFMLFLVYKSFNNRDNSFEEVNIKQTIDNNMFAIMIQNDSGKYEESSINSWPTKGYVFNSALSSCIDNNGNELKNVLTFSDGIAKIKTHKSTYCYLYFDMFKENLSELVMNLGENNGVYHEYIEVATNNAVWTTLTEDEYIVNSNDETWPFVFNDGMWNSNHDNNCGWDEHGISISPKDEGHYQFCLNSSGYNQYISFNGVNFITVNNERAQDFDFSSAIKCYDLGKIDSSDIIKVLNPNCGETRFYMQKTDNYSSIDLGYKYKGSNPNNYIKLSGSDDLWRIIGVENGGSIGLDASKYYTKIIMNDSYLERKYNLSSYEQSSPYQTFVDYQQNNTIYFLNNDNTLLSKVENYTVDSAIWYYANQTLFNDGIQYLKERKSSGYTGKVGLPYISDYQYAPWMFGYNEFVGAYCYGYFSDVRVTNSAMYVNVSKNFDCIRGEYTHGEGYDTDSYSVRPVIYLDYDFAITGGTGTASDPYTN